MSYQLLRRKDLNVNRDQLTKIAFNKNGSLYAIYKVNVQRGIKGKNKSKVDEVLIWGIPKSGAEKFLIKNNLDPLIKYLNTDTVINCVNDVEKGGNL